MICGSGGSKSRRVKAAGAEPAGQWRDENLHAIVARRVREAHLEAKSVKTRGDRKMFGSGDVGKMQTVVARSTS